MYAIITAAAFAAAFWAMPATAQDAPAQPPCTEGLVCASKPETIVAAMDKAGYKPKISTVEGGDPVITSDEGPYGFEVYFYGCDKQHANCDSIRFESVFVKAPENTFELANKWNKDKRFLQAYVRDDGAFAVSYDVAMIGGLNQRNFQDVLDWWGAQLDELAKFFKSELNLPDPPAAPEKK